MDNIGIGIAEDVDVQQALANRPLACEWHGHVLQGHTRTFVLTLCRCNAILQGMAGKGLLLLHGPVKVSCLVVASLDWIQVWEARLTKYRRP